MPRAGGRGAGIGLEVLLLLAVAAVVAEVAVEQLSSGEFFRLFLLLEILHRFCNTGKVRGKPDEVFRIRSDPKLSA